MEYCDHIDRQVIKAVVNATLDYDPNFQISLFDGEETSVEATRNIKAIYDEATATGEDWYNIQDSEGQHVGSFYLIYCNRAQNDDPIVTISDYAWGSENAEANRKIMDSIYADVERRVDEALAVS